ncbi:MAG: hypothetical protein SF162_12380 [bacterium]|nr:hypothetical protein [bacterium]
MEILGVGGWELIAVLVLMLVVAGPKRMIHWSYLLGRELAKLRRMWSETAKVLQKELDTAGIDYQIPEQPPTRAGLRNEAAKLLTPITKPMQDAMHEVDQELGDVKQVASTVNNLKFSGQTRPPAAKPMPAKPAPVTNGTPANGGTPAKPMPTAKPAGTTANGSGSFGSWSGAAAQPQNDAPAAPADGFGAWSKPADDPQP